MKQRKLGHSPLEASTIGLGCMTMTGLYDAADDAESIATIHEAIERGMNFLDSSDAYGNGGNEELVGKAIAGRRDKVVLATKFGNVRKPDGKPGADGRPEYVVEACEKSLRRLGVEVIDLYYQHRVDPDVPIEETVGAMARLIEQGKVISLGMSEAAAETLRRGHATHPISALQTEYSLFCRFAEQDLLPACAELGVTFVAYSPLGRGFLTGAVRALDDLGDQDRRRDHPRFTADNIAHNVAMLGPIETIAANHGATPAQIAIAWLLARGDDVLPIPGTKNRAHLADNIAAGDIALTAAEVAALDDAAPVGFTAGERYPPGGMKTVDI
jgi:aryl-alcohol dehydrogenase-like predicted oxidoreductase